MLSIVPYNVQNMMPNNLQGHTTSALPLQSRMITSFINRELSQGRGPISDQPTSQLPATIQQAEVAIDQRAPNVVPALIADLGDAAAWRYVEFFTANIRNPHTRRAYARACSRFFAWCEDRGLTPATIRPHDVGTYIEQLQHTGLGAVGQAAARRDPDDVRLAGHGPDRAAQPGLRGARPEACRQGRQDAGARSRGLAQAAQLDPDRERARSARPGADRDTDLQLCAHQCRPEDEGRGSAAARRGWSIRLHEKGGKQHTMPCHHALAEALHAYIGAAGIADDRKGWLFRTARGHKGSALSEKPMGQPDAWRMIRRRAAAAGIAEAIGCHTFRATGITAYLANGGALEHAQEMAAHESPRTTKLYDRTKERLTQDEVERIRL